MRFFGFSSIWINQLEKAMVSDLEKTIVDTTKKRFHFLSDLLGLEWTTKNERMMEELGPVISLLDPAAPDQGRISATTW